MSSPELKTTETFISEAVNLRAAGKPERVLIENLIARLRQMFPEAPAWIDAHIREAESQVSYQGGGKSRAAYIDNLVGYTTIEYERNLSIPAVFKTGYEQVKQHAAGLLNDGAPKEKVLGVLSDTIEWRAYRIKNVNAQGPPIGPDQLELDEVKVIDLAGGTTRDAQILLDFLSTYLGRVSARRLAAETVTFDLGFESTFGKRYLAKFAAVVDEAFQKRPEYADVLERLWANLMGFISEAQEPEFDRALYVNELYIVTLAKLLCANIIARESLNSDDGELAAILDGRHFRAKGLENLVEYDYFGWLNANPWVDELIPIAREMQAGLRSYDFEAPASEDLFGLLLAQLATRAQRLLLGQEATPPWLAARVARRVFGAVPKGQRPRILDMCCGSGSMLIEVVKLAMAKHTGVVDQDAVLELSEVAAGFDIDPLAVLLAKVNWVVTARSWLDPFDGSRRVSIPIYQADSLFVRTAVGATNGTASGTYSLELHKHPVALPAFLVAPESRALFDALLDRAYRVGMAVARASGSLDSSDVTAAVDDACGETSSVLGTEQRQAVTTFVRQLINTLADLQRQSLNGIWAFVLRNSYRPGLVVGQFNGLISNPPWLALSKLADNPYRDALDAEAATYGIKPRGSAHLHTELATTFLLHAVDHYLSAGATVAVILPDPILNGSQHQPFRGGAYSKAERPVDLDVRQLWRVEPGTFKNEAIVLVGAKAKRVERQTLPGMLVTEARDSKRQFQVVNLAKDVTAWTDTQGAASAATFQDIDVKQGVDVMPRRAIFFEATRLSSNRYRLAPIDRAKSPFRYLISDEKRLKDFTISPTTVPGRFIFDVLLSKHVVHFDISTPAKAFLPIERTAGTWTVVSTTRLAAMPSAEAAFDEILDALGDGAALSLGGYFELLNTRNKLAQQRFPGGGHLFVYGAGGAIPCAAYAPLSDFDTERLIIDQTLYWTVVADEDEAVYLTGLFNSEALASRIAEFQARGAFGRRHIHELPPTVTPGFDPNDSDHVAVVKVTRKLISELRTARAKKPSDPAFDPNRALTQRRAKVREMVEGLPSLSRYQKACAALYRGLPSP